MPSDFLKPTRFSLLTSRYSISPPHRPLPHRIVKDTRLRITNLPLERSKRRLRLRAEVAGRRHVVALGRQNSLEHAHILSRHAVKEVAPDHRDREGQMYRHRAEHLAGLRRRDGSRNRDPRITDDYQRNKLGLESVYLADQVFNCR